MQQPFNERLIQEVKKHPSLYNQTKRSFTDTMERMKIWDDIAAAIDPKVTGEFAKKRWLQLRDRYRKELKVAIRQNFSIPQRWCYFSHLSWLDPYLKDNLALATPSGLPRESSSPFGLNLDAFMKSDYDTKQELDDGFDDTFDEELFRANVSSALAGVLAATQSTPRERSNSPNLTDGDAAPSASDTPTSTPSSSGNMHNCVPEKEDDEEKDSDLRMTGPSPPMIEPAPRTLSLADLSSQQGISKTARLLIQANHSMLEWINDEELLYARIVGLKLKKLDSRRRKRVKAEILALLEESDDDTDTVSSKSARLNPELAGEQE